MDLRQFDLNLLVVLDALLKERNVTQAAQRLDMSQPAVSAALKKLRTAFGEELFTKSARGIEPTRFALSLLQPLTAALRLIDDGLLNHGAFHPEVSRRTFVVIAGELGQTMLVPTLLRQFWRQAPYANLRVITPSVAERPAYLEDGRADLAVGHFPQLLRFNLYQQVLYRRPMVCLARRGHPALMDGNPSLEAFSALDHAIIGTGASFHELYQPQLKLHGVEPRNAVEVSAFGAAPFILSESDLVAFVPESLAQHYMRDWPLATFVPPFDLPQFEVRQFWHGRVNQDQGVMWLRKLLAEQFSDSRANASDATSCGPR